MSGTIDTSGLLNIIYGLSGASSGSTSTAGSTALTLLGGSSASSTSATNVIPALKLAEANQTKDIAQQASDPQVARDIATFRTKVAAATDPATLLKDPSVLKVLLTANGLGGQEAFPALAQKALLSNTTDPKALANVLSNTAFKTTAQLYDFANKGLSVLQNPKVIDTLANGYAEVLWRKSLDQTTPGLSNALTFRDRASSITSVDQILGDSTLRTVVTTTLGIPQELAYQPLTTQENAISSQLDITKFSDPKFVETFTQRYLLAANPPNTSGSSSLTQLAVASRGLVV